MTHSVNLNSMVMKVAHLLLSQGAAAEVSCTYYINLLFWESFAISQLKNSHQTRVALVYSAKHSERNHVVIQKLQIFEFAPKKFVKLNFRSYF